LNQQNVGISGTLKPLTLPVPPPPPLPVPLPPPLPMGTNISGNSVIDLIKDRKKNEKSKVLKMVNKTQFKPPSASDIQSMLKNLKKRK
jgi:hypothetical protein